MHYYLVIDTGLQGEEKSNYRLDKNPKSENEIESVFQVRPNTSFFE